MPKRGKRSLRARLKRTFGAATLGAVLTVSAALANPSGGTVSAGAANITNVAPGAMQIEQLTQKAIIDWQKFGIGAGESVRFLQPNQLSVILNRVVGQDPSKILGQLSANGNVFLINPNGILFGPNSVVNVGGLVASTLQISNEDFLSGNYRFSQDARKALASVINKGKITISDGGYALLVAPMVSNEGLIVANLGTVNMLGTERATLNFDGRNLITYDIGPVTSGDPGTVLLNHSDVSDLLRTALLPKSVQQADSLVQNPDGTISLKAGSGTVVNQGTISAQGADGRAAGHITLDSTNQTILGDHSVLRADGLGQHSDGGSVQALSRGTLSTQAGGVLSARGGEVSGNGGFIETSGAQHLSLQSLADVGVIDGKAGVWLIDPTTLTIVDDPGSINLADTISTGFLEGVTSGTLDLAATGEILIEDIADNQLTMQDGVSLSLSAPSLVFADGADAIRVGGNADLTVDVGSAGIQNLGLLLNEGTGAVDLTVEGAVTDGNGTGVTNMQADTVHLLSSTGSIGSSSSPLEVSADKVDGSGARGFYVTDLRELDTFAIDSNGSDAVVSAPNGTLSLVGGVLSTPVKITDTNGDADGNGFDVSTQVNYTGGDLTLRDIVFDDNSASFYAYVDSGNVVSGGGTADVTNLGDLDFNLQALNGGLGSVGSPISFSTTSLINISTVGYGGDVALKVDNTPREFFTFYKDQVDATFTGGGISNLSGSLVIEGDPGVSRIGGGTTGDLQLGSFNLDGTPNGLLEAGGNLQATVDGVTDVDAGTGLVELYAGGKLEADLAGTIKATVTGDATLRNDTGLTLDYTTVGGDMTIVNNAPLTMSNADKVAGTLQIENASTVDVGGSFPSLDAHSLIVNSTAANTSVSLNKVTTDSISIDDSAQGGGNFSLGVNGSVSTVNVLGKGTDFRIGALQKTGTTLNTGAGGSTDFDEVSISEAEDALAVDATSLVLPSTSSLTLVTTNPGAGVSTSVGGIEVAGDLSISSAGPINVGTIVPGTLELYAAEGTISFGDGYSAAPKAVKVRSGDGSTIYGNWHYGSMTYNANPYVPGLSVSGEPGATDIEFQLDKGDLQLNPVGGKNVKIVVADGGISGASSLVLYNSGDLDLQARDDIGSVTVPLILDSSGTVTAQSTTGGVYLHNDAPAVGNSGSGYQVGNVTAFGDIVLDFNPALSLAGVVESQTGNVAISTAYDNLFIEPGGMVKANGGSSTVSLEAQNYGGLTERNGTDPAVQALGGTVVVKAAMGDVDLNIDAAAVAVDSPGTLTVNDLDTNGDGLQVVSGTTMVGGNMVITQGTDVVLDTVGDLVVDQAIDATGFVQLTSSSGNLEIGSSVTTTGGLVYLYANNGSITDTNGAGTSAVNVLGGDLVLQTGGDIALEFDGAAVIASGQNMTLRDLDINGDGLTLKNGLSGKSLSLQTEGDLLDDNGDDTTVISATELVLKAGGNIGGTGSDDDFETSVESLAAEAGGSLTVQESNALTVSAGTAADGSAVNGVKAQGDVSLSNKGTLDVKGQVTSAADDVSLTAVAGTMNLYDTITSGAGKTITLKNTGLGHEIVDRNGDDLNLDTGLGGTVVVDSFMDVGISGDGALEIEAGQVAGRSYLDNLALYDVDSQADGLTVSSAGGITGVQASDRAGLSTSGDLKVDEDISSTSATLESRNGSIEVNSHVYTFGDTKLSAAKDILDLNSAGDSAVEAFDLALEAGGRIGGANPGEALDIVSNTVAGKAADEMVLSQSLGLPLAVGSNTGLGGSPLEGLQSDGSVTLTSDGDVTLNSAIVAGTSATLEVGGNLIDGNGLGLDLSGSSVSLTAGGDLGAATDALEVDAAALSAKAGGALYLDVAGDTVISGVLQAANDLCLTGAGELRLQTDAVSTGGNVALSTSGDIVFDAAGAKADGAVVSLESGGDITDQNGAGSPAVVASDTAVLKADGSIGGAGGDTSFEVSLPKLAGSTGGALHLALQGDTALTSATTLKGGDTVTGLTAGQDLALSSDGSLSIDQAVSAAGDATIDVQGELQVNAAVSSTSADVGLRASGDLTLKSGGSVGAPASLASLESGGSIISEDGVATASVQGKQTVVLAQGDVQLGLSTDTLAAKGTNVHIVDHGGDLTVGTLTTKIGKVQVVGVSANGNAGVEAEDGNLQLDSPVSGTSVTVTAGGGAVHNASSDTLKATDTLTLVSHDDINLDHTLEAGKRVNLESTAGEIHAGDHSVDVRAPEVTLQASGDIGKPLQPISLDTDKVAAVSHNGGVYLKDRNQLEITTLDTTNGPVNGVSGAGDVAVIVGNGDLTVGGMSAGGDVGLTASNGSILDGNGTDPNVSAGGDVTLSAANGRVDSLDIQASGTVKVSENQPQGVINTATNSSLFRPVGLLQGPSPFLVPSTAFAQDNLSTGEYDDFLRLLDLLSNSDEMGLIVDMVTGPIDDDE